MNSSNIKTNFGKTTKLILILIVKLIDGLNSDKKHKKRYFERDNEEK